MPCVVGGIDRGRARSDAHGVGDGNDATMTNVWRFAPSDGDARTNDGRDARTRETEASMMFSAHGSRGEVVRVGVGRGAGVDGAVGANGTSASAAFVSDDACVVFGSGKRGVLIMNAYDERGGSVRVIEGEDGSEGTTRATPTVCAATRTPSGRASAVVGDADGDLYEIVGDIANGKLSIRAFDRKNRSHWVDDMHDDEEAGGEGRATASPTKTPGKNRAWGALRSATMAAGGLLSRKHRPGGVRSLSFVDGSSETRKRLLVCVSDGALEEWSIDVSNTPRPAKLAHAHNIVKQIQRALRTSSNVSFVSADWTLTDMGVDITLLVECDGKGSLHRFQRAHGTDALEIVASAVPAAGALPNNLNRVRLYVEGEDTFVLAEDGSAALFTGLDYSRVLARMDASNHEPILDVKCVRPGEWVLLSDEGGVTTFNPHTRQTTPRRAGKVTPNKRTSRGDGPSANAVDDADAIECVRTEFENYLAGQSGSRDQTKSRLRAAGAFVSEAVPFATMSKSSIDALPKKLSGKSNRGGPSIEEHVSEKIGRYLSFLDFLTESGVWNDIDSDERLEILTHGEMISATSRFVDLKNTADDEARTILEEIATHAGAEMKAIDSALDERSDLEVCFSRSSEVCSMFPATASVLEKRLKENNDLEQRALILDTCARGLLVSIEAANDFRRRRTTMYPHSASSGVSWMCEMEAREALHALASVTIKLQAEAAESTTGVGLGPVLGSRLQAVAAPLLDACAAYLNAALPHSTERIDAHDEYVKNRTTLLSALLNCAKQSATVPLHSRPQHGPLTEGADVTIESVAAVAEAHFGYAELFEICDTAGGVPRLHHYMRTLLGAQEDGEESFAHFVYQKLAIEQDRDAVLLRDLPVEFHGDLERFLASHPDLRWLMELRVGKYSEASETLAAIGNRDGADALKKRRALSLAKLALLAAGGNVEDRMDVIDTALAA